MTKAISGSALVLLMLVVLACTCGNLSNTNNSNNSNSIGMDDNTNENKSNDNKTSNNSNKKPPTGGGASTGIAECDTYLNLIDEYLNCPNVPESSREQWRKQRSETAERIQEAAKNETGKQIMASACQQMVASIEKEVEKCR